MSDLPAGSIDPYALGGSAAGGFAPGTIIAHILATGTTGARIEIGGPVPTGRGAGINFYTGFEGATGKPVTEWAAGTSTVTNFFIASGYPDGADTTNIPQIILQDGLTAGSGSVAISTSTINLLAGTARGQAANQGASEFGNVPLALDGGLGSTIAGTAFANLTQWPLIQCGQTGVLTTDATGTVTIPFPHPFPNGVGVVLVSIVGWSSVAFHSLNAGGAATLTGQPVRMFNTAGAPYGAGQQYILNWLAIGW